MDIMRIPTHRALMLMVLLCLACPSVAPADMSGGLSHDQQEAVLREIGVDEHLGAAVPLDLTLTDQDGAKVALGEYFRGGPVILSLNYYECPMLCPVTFANLSRTIDDMRGLELGRDFRVATVSFNPDETEKMAREKSGETYRMLKDAKDPGHSWPFLFGGPDEIKRITSAVGFRYKALGPDNFAHPSVLVILSPEGKVTRYLYGIKQEPLDLQLALTEAAQGRIGASTALNRVLLFCYHYDPVGKKYALAATRLMTAGGTLTLILVGGLLVMLWRQEKGKGGGR